jgi:hypothetical protein
VQVPHQGDDHHPPRLTRALAFSLVALAAALAVDQTAGAAAHGTVAPKYTALPSPSAPLSNTPPLGGGAAASSEAVRHRIDATTTVRVSVDHGGAPFAVGAVQTLRVQVQGDYFFTIGAPVLSAHAAPGSHSEPGVRTASILWAGFNPGRRTLAASISLELKSAAAALPLRIAVKNGQVTLVNRTRIEVQGFSADAVGGPLRAYARQLEAAVITGRQPSAGGVLVTSPPRPATFHAVARLHITGTIGTRAVDVVLGESPVTIAARGAIHLQARTSPPIALLRQPKKASGRLLLGRVSGALFDLARDRQYDTYLGNPDPAGDNETTYAYSSANRPPVATTTVRARSGRSALQTLAIVAGLLAALAAGVVAWARS